MKGSGATLVSNPNKIDNEKTADLDADDEDPSFGKLFLARLKSTSR